MAAVFPSLVPQVQTLLAARSRLPGKQAALSAVAELLALAPREDASQDEVTLRTR